MTPFLHEDFLLSTPTAVWLFHDVAASLPIIDYHCHLPPAHIADDHRFSSLTEIWLADDHYKWRAMRACGVPERLITGDASAWDKFAAWAAVVPQTLRNPLYHWTHLELARPFGVRGVLLGPDTARAVFDRCNERLREPAFSAQGLLRQARVRVVCTTDDPADDLAAHARHANATTASTTLVPTWRPDKALGIDNPPRWNAWLARLEAASGIAIQRLDDLRAALAVRHDAFAARGCRLSDHGLLAMDAAAYTETEIRAAFDDARAGRTPDALASARFRSAMLYELALLDHAKGWVQQFHLGALRNTNTRALGTLGPDTGFDSMGDPEQANGLARFLDRLDSTNQLAKTILYNHNPRDNELFATMAGNYQDGSVPGKMQFGAAWWFLDQKDGMERQIDVLSAMGVLSRFVGMTTDSRSFLSYARHEYFRRILCAMLGNDVERGLLPNDKGLLAGLVRGVCFENARDYFGLPLGSE